MSELQTPQARPSLADEVAAQRRAEQTGALVMAARSLARRGQTVQARARLKEAFAHDPTDCAALELLGDLFMEEGEQEKAIRVFQRGKEYHPAHAAFEEKMGLAHVDLATMQRDAERRKLVLEGGDPDRLLDREPSRAFGLSLLVPGAGQFYNEDSTRGIIFLSVAVFLFFLWGVPFSIGLGQLPEGSRTPGAVVAQWPALGQLLFYGVLLCWMAAHLGAAYDAWMGAQRANYARRRELGIE